MKIKLLSILVNTIIIIFIVVFTINLFLNKKYAVDEISFTDRQQGLEGIQEIVSDDYIHMIYLNVLYILVLVVYMVLYKRK